MDKKALVVLVAVATLAIVFVASSQFRGIHELKIIVPPFVAEYVATYALENGLVEAQLPPFKVEHTLQFNEAMLSLQGDVGFMSTEAFAKAYEAGKPLRILCTAVIQGNEVGNALVFVKSSSPIQHPSQLAEAKLGIPSPRGLKSTNLIFLEVMEKRFNVTVDLSSPLLIDKPLPQLPTLLDAGEVDAVLVFGDVAAQMALQPEKYRLLCDVSSEFRDLYGEYPVVAVLVAKSELLEERPEIVRGVVEALNASLSYGLSHLDEALPWALEARGGMAAEVALEALRQYQVRFTLTQLDREVILRILELAYERGLVSVPPDPREVFAWPSS